MVVGVVRCVIECVIECVLRYACDKARVCVVGCDSVW